LEQPPVGVRQTLQEFADLEVIARHRADVRHQFPADVFGDGLLVDFGGEVITALGRSFVERALQEIQRQGDLTFELLFAEVELLRFFAHVYAYYYPYNNNKKIRLSRENDRISAKDPPMTLNCYNRGNSLAR